MGAPSDGPLVLDAGALIAFERRVVRVRVLIETALRHRRRLIVPAGVVAQVWRDGARQARMATLVNDERVEVVALGLEEAKAVGLLCGRARSRDVVDAHVALVARRLTGTVVTSDRHDISRFDRSLRVVAV